MDQPANSKRPVNANPRNNGNPQVLARSAGLCSPAAIEKWAADPEDVSLLRHAVDLIEVSQQLFLKPELWKATNIAFHIQKNFYPTISQKRLRNDSAKEWCALFELLMSHLNLNPMEIQAVPKSEIVAE